MSAEYRNPNGSWSQGYYCMTCGETTNMMGTGHGAGKCEANPTLVKQLNRANPAPGVKPHFTLTTKDVKY